MLEKPVLVTGATGYVGGRLVPRLLAAGYRVRALGRSLGKLRHRPWGSHPLIELAQGDVMDAESLRQAAQGCWAAFYLVHSMTAAAQDFAAADRQAASNMVQAAAAAGLDRIIYLGGLGGADDPNLSEHLRSRFEVARILQSGAVPTTFLRAAMILGSGGAAFEILRYLVDRLPVMLTPRWVHTPVQPIAIRNVLTYLIGCLEHDETRGQTFDIGGPEVVTYRQLMDIYAQ
ncbi:MAG: NAD(P)H-binding protein, partial [Deltaproteobacteria bacterium]|nr:NAD(P)H-binding protein [Deltaproteobacteria bacterium]